jgi:DNA-binding MarR family transcriptional regulator
VATLVEVLYALHLLGHARWRLLYTFAEVMFEEGLSVAEYAEHAGLAPSSMSRNLLDLGAADQDHRPGLNLIVSRPHHLNRRVHASFLTDDGRRISRAVVCELVKRALRVEE